MRKANKHKRIERAASDVAPQERTTGEDWTVLSLRLLKGDKRRFEEYAREKGAAPSVLGRMILLEAMKAA